MGEKKKDEEEKKKKKEDEDKKNKESEERKKKDKEADDKKKKEDEEKKKKDNNDPTKGFEKITSFGGITFDAMRGKEEKDDKTNEKDNFGGVMDGSEVSKSN